MLLRALICVVVAAVPTASLGGFGVRRVSTSRAGLGVRRLGGAPRAAVAAPAADPAAAAIKEEILAMTRPFGDPAINVPPDVQAAVSAKCKELEALNPTAKPATADAASNDGVWRVRYSDAVPPSNGQIGPFVGEVSLHTIHCPLSTARRQYHHTPAPSPPPVAAAADHITSTTTAVPNHRHGGRSVPEPARLGVGQGSAVCGLEDQRRL